MAKSGDNDAACTVAPVFRYRSVRATSQSPSPALHKIAVAELGFRISDCTLRHPAGDAHLGETDADGLGVEHLCANRLGEILGIDHVGNDRAAERQQDLGPRLVEQTTHDL